MSEQECDPGDIACQVRIIKNLQGLTEELGAEEMHDQFPELDGLEGTIADKLRNRQDVMKSTLVSCGILREDEALEEVLEEGDVAVSATVAEEEPVDDEVADAKLAAEEA